MSTITAPAPRIAPEPPAAAIALARRQIIRYELELVADDVRATTTETAVVHRAIVELALADWRRRLAAITEGA